MGTVYLIHLDTPLCHARHYMGYTENLDERIAAHRKGNGARFMEVVTEAGIGWKVVRTWENATREDERRMKNSRHVPRYCPECKREAKRQRKQGAH